jgi:hypothetical protein
LPPINPTKERQRERKGEREKRDKGPCEKKHKPSFVDIFFPHNFRVQTLTEVHLFKEF